MNASEIERKECWLLLNKVNNEEKGVNKLSFYPTFNLHEAVKQLVEKAQQLQAENELLRDAFEEIIVESGKVHISNWPAQQQICQMIAQKALKQE